MRCPIKTSGAGAQSTYTNYDDPQALLLPDAKRLASLQVLCMRDLLQNVSTILQRDFFHSSTPTNVIRSFVAGIPCRPVLPNQGITMKFVWSYLQRLNSSIALHKPIFSDNVNRLCWLDEIVEKSSGKRWTLNAAFMRRLRATRNGGA